MKTIKDFNKRGKQYVLTGHITAVKYEKRLRALTLSGFIQSLLYMLATILSAIIQMFMKDTHTSEKTVERGYAKLKIKTLDQRTFNVTTSAELENKIYLKEGQLVTVICTTPVGAENCYSPVFIAHKDNAIIPSYDNHGEHTSNDYFGRFALSLLVVLTGFSMASSTLGYDIALTIANSINLSKFNFLALTTFLLPIGYLAIRYKLLSCQNISYEDYKKLVQSGPSTEDFINTGPQPSKSDTDKPIDTELLNKTADETKSSKKLEILSLQEAVDYMKEYAKKNASQSVDTSPTSTSDSIVGDIVSSSDEGLQEALDFIKLYNEENYPTNPDGLIMKLTPVVVIDRNAKTNIGNNSGGYKEVSTKLMSKGITTFNEEETTTHTWEARSFNTSFAFIVKDENGNKVYLPVDEYIGNNTQLGDIILVADIGYKENELTTQYIYNVNVKIHSHTKQSIEVNKPSVNIFSGFIPSIVITFLLWGALLSKIPFFSSISPIVITITPYILMVSFKAFIYASDQKDWREQKNKRSYLFNIIKILDHKSFSTIPTRDSSQW